MHEDNYFRHYWAIDLTQLISLAVTYLSVYNFNYSEKATVLALLLVKISLLSLRI